MHTRTEGWPQGRFAVHVRGRGGRRWAAHTGEAAHTHAVAADIHREAASYLTPVGCHTWPAARALTRGICYTHGQLRTGWKLQDELGRDD